LTKTYCVKNDGDPYLEQAELLENSIIAVKILGQKFNVDVVSRDFASTLFDAKIRHNLKIFDAK